MVYVYSNLTRRPTPPMMRGSELPIEHVEGRWWVLHLKARNEKALAWELYDSGIDYFLPLVRRPSTYGRRRVEIDIPLFPGYMFFWSISDDDRYQVIRTHRVANILEVSDQARLKVELEQVRLAVQSLHKVDLYPGIKRGRRCRITSGSLKGLEGVVINCGRTGRVFLDVSMLGQSAVVEIDVTFLESAE